MSDKIRQFDSGATRDTNVGKLDYEGFLSPLVLKRYAEYLNKHRIQSDGKLRNSDNWQKGIPIKEYMKSKWRHFMDTWRWYRIGPKLTGLHVEESLCAEMFNTMGMLFEVLKAKNKNKPFVCPAGWSVGRVPKIGWYVNNSDLLGHLWKDLIVHTADTGWTGHKFGEAPGYWPTKEAAEDALKQYLEKNNG
ncbi:hypothetical protein KAR91_57660 [Candidatus Pacearchaeota archaeon]|nr:hypothetical protein [Candidatus Pacearchaeota archaeon]